MCPSGADCEAVTPMTNVKEKIKQEDLGENAISEWTYTPNKSVSLRFLMSRREAGCLIGRNGETITFLRKRSGAKIKVSDSGVKERIVSTSGSITVVLRAVRQFCREFAWVSSDRIDVANVSNIPKFLFRILLPASICGHLIGQHGECIHKLRQITGSFLKITRQRLPNSTDRILFVYGTVASITACLETICALLGEIKYRPHDIPYIPSTENHSHLCSKVPSSFHRNEKFPTLVLSTPWVFQKRRRKTGNQNVFNDILPSLAQPNAVSAKGSLLPSSAIIPPTSSLLSHMAEMHSSAVFSASYYCPASLISSILLTASHLAEDVVRRDMLIDNDLIGCVIGRGGMKINEIRKASQATIHISNDENSLPQQHGPRLITITGSSRAVESAVDMINANLQYREATLMPSEITQPVL